MPWPATYSVTVTLDERVTQVTAWWTTPEWQPRTEIATFTDPITVEDAWEWIKTFQDALDEDPF